MLTLASRDPTVPQDWSTFRPVTVQVPGRAVSTPPSSR